MDIQHLEGDRKRKKIFHAGRIGAEETLSLRKVKDREAWRPHTGARRVWHSWAALWVQGRQEKYRI